MRWAVVALALVLTSCATPEPRIITERVEVPVPVPCVKHIPLTPHYPDTADAIKAEPSLFAKVQLLLAGRELRIAHEDELASTLKACTAAQ